VGLLKHALAVSRGPRLRQKFGEPERNGASSRCSTTSTTSGGRHRNIIHSGAEILEAQGYPEWLRHRGLSHADYSGVPRKACSKKHCSPATRWRDS
jgi:hypothetical protein